MRDDLGFLSQSHLQLCAPGWVSKTEGKESAVGGNSTETPPTNLRVRELVHAAAALHTEVSPHLRRWSQVQLVNPATGGLEAILCVLAGDAHRHHMALRLTLGRALQVKVCSALGVLPVQAADGWDPSQGDAHANHELAGRKVDACDAFCHWVLHL